MGAPGHWRGVRAGGGRVVFLTMWLIVWAVVKRAASGAWALVTAYPRATACALLAAALWWAHSWDLDRKLTAQSGAQAAAYEREKQQAANEFAAAINAKRAEVAQLVSAQQALNETWRARWTAAKAQADQLRSADLKKVSAYVTPVSDSRCIVPVGFLRYAQLYVTDTANGQRIIAGQEPAETVSTETVELVERASGVPLSAISRWQREFGAVAQEWRNRALACDRWVDEQAAAFNQSRGEP